MQVMDSEGKLEDAHSPITMLNLFTHTSGLTYPFMTALCTGAPNPVASRYMKEKIYGSKDLEEVVEKLATMPLVNHPGEWWNYGMGIDVLGRVVEVLSGCPLDVYFEENIFAPLRMQDTHFMQRLEPSMEGRLHKGYAMLPDDPSISPATYNDGEIIALPNVFADFLNLGRPNGDLRQGFLEPGGGLVSSLDDWGRFAQCLCNGGSLDGQRILGSRTIEFLSMNHLPRECKSSPMLRLISDTPANHLSPRGTGNGMGFGLGVAVTLDVATTGGLGSTGEFGWGGATSTMVSIHLQRYTCALSNIYPSTPHSSLCHRGSSWQLWRSRSWCRPRHTVGGRSSSRLFTAA